jgi:hypothetical protein
VAAWARAVRRVRARSRERRFIEGEVGRWWTAIFQGVGSGSG